MRILIFGTLICSIFTIRSASNLKKYIRVCHDSDSNFSQCMKKSMDMMKPYLRTGVPELSIPPFEPLFIPKIEGHTTFLNVNVWGLSKFEIQSFQTNPKLKEFKLKIHFPRLRSKSFYKFLKEPESTVIKGDRILYGNYTDVNSDVSIQGDTKRKKIHNTVIDWNISDVKTYFNNLAPGEDELGEVLNAYLNDNWKSIGRIMNDAKKILHPCIQNMVKNIFNTIYYSS